MVHGRVLLLIIFRALEIFSPPSLTRSCGSLRFLGVGFWFGGRGRRKWRVRAAIQSIVVQNVVKSLLLVVSDFFDALELGGIKPQAL